MIYAFDPDVGQVVYRKILWPDSDVCYVAGIHPSGILVAMGASEIALVDTANREVLYQGKMGVTAPAVLRRGADGMHYFVRDDKMWRWNLDTNTITPVLATEELALFTEVTPGEWIFAGKQGICKARVPDAHR